MIPPKWHLQRQLLTLIKCPELLGQICWTDLSWPAEKGWGLFKDQNNGAEFAFQIQMRWDPE